ncbi:nucleotide pyrophosphohydrolase [Vagococcus salmoninarum]|uniref:nucleotide pyrophosphohydrolase n=1 Tax=Vagococcus salmoninarum TaxID=2739 RepID=UPI001880079B|nr:nucleotide pyrophosphohydrolase [Vagococcus salmoninarum]MBE9389729.1 nucleotide pyrophosphohydrolase [Vagococcus salmoninarum]
MDKLIKVINEFRDDRDWRQFHTPKDLALSISLEASELLENFQWKDSKEAIKENRENIQDEIADVLMYLMMLSDDLDIDLYDAITKKIEKNKLKYPVDKSKGNNKKYTDF